MTPLLRGQARIVLRYSLISATTLSVNASALLLCATTPQYYTVPSGTYCVVSYSFIITSLSSKKKLYDKVLNKNKNKAMDIVLL